MWKAMSPFPTLQTKILKFLIHFYKRTCCLSNCSCCCRSCSWEAVAAALCCCAARRTPDNWDKSSAIGSMLSLADDIVADAAVLLVTALVKGFPRRILGGPPPRSG